MDDMNINLAMSIVLEEVKQLNQLLRQRDLNISDVVNHDHTLRTMMSILGIACPFPHLSTEEVELVKAWHNAKAHKDFEKADGFRNQLIERGVLT
jgi:cysteinyl-tRNA synthetase